VTDTPVPPPPPPDVPPQPPVPPKPAASAPHPQQRDLLTPGMLEALKKTKPWVRFLSILGFISAGLMILVALGVTVAGVFQLTQGQGAGAVLVGMSALYLVMGILYIFPSRFLYRYATAIGTALDAKYKSHAVEQALQQQKSFWKFAGIMALVIVLLYIPGILAAIAIPNLLTAMQRSKQKRSMADLRTIAAALEARATDQNEYPSTRSTGDLARVLEPTYVKAFPRADGWGNLFVYEGVDCIDENRCQGYVLASGGKNGKLETPPSELPRDTTETTENFDEDIVFANGRFIRAPEGAVPASD
jgi:general secretion pathway protein G